MHHGVALLALPLLVGCGGQVIIDGSGGATSASSPASSSSSSKAATSSTGSGFTTGASSSTGGTSPACADAYVDVDTGSGPVHLVGSCPNAWGSNESSRPVAFFTAGGALAGQLTILACLGPTSTAPRVQAVGFGIDTEVPSASTGTVTQYIDDSNTMWFPTAKSGAVTVTHMGKLGELVEGSFSGDVTSGGKVLSVTGTFRACRVDDLALP